MNTTTLPLEIAQPIRQATAFIHTGMLLVLLIVAFMDLSRTRAYLIANPSGWGWLANLGALKFIYNDCTGEVHLPVCLSSVCKCGDFPREQASLLNGLILELGPGQVRGHQLDQILNEPTMVRRATDDYKPQLPRIYLHGRLIFTRAACYLLLMHHLSGLPMCAAEPILILHEPSIFWWWSIALSISHVLATLALLLFPTRWNGKRLLSHAITFVLINLIEYGAQIALSTTVFNLVAGCIGVLGCFIIAVVVGLIYHLWTSFSVVTPEKKGARRFHDFSTVAQILRNNRFLGAWLVLAIVFIFLGQSAATKATCMGTKTGGQLPQFGAEVKLHAYHHSIGDLRETVAEAYTRIDELIHGPILLVDWQQKLRSFNFSKHHDQLFIVENGKDLQNARQVPLVLKCWNTAQGSVPLCEDDNLAVFDKYDTNVIFGNESCAGATKASASPVDTHLAGLVCKTHTVNIFLPAAYYKMLMTLLREKTQRVTRQMLFAATAAYALDCYMCAHSDELEKLGQKVNDFETSTLEALASTEQAFKKTEKAFAAIITQTNRRFDAVHKDIIELAEHMQNIAVHTNLKNDILAATVWRTIQVLNMRQELRDLDIDLTMLLNAAKLQYIPEGNLVIRSLRASLPAGTLVRETVTIESSEFVYKAYIAPIKTPTPSNQYDFQTCFQLTDEHVMKSAPIRMYETLTPAGVMAEDGIMFAQPSTYRWSKLLVAHRESINTWSDAYLVEAELTDYTEVSWIAYTYPNGFLVVVVAKKTILYCTKQYDLKPGLTSIQLAPQERCTMTVDGKTLKIHIATYHATPSSQFTYLSQAIIPTITHLLRDETNVTVDITPIVADLVGITHDVGDLHKAIATAKKTQESLQQLITDLHQQNLHLNIVFRNLSTQVIKLADDLVHLPITALHEVGSVVQTLLTSPALLLVFLAAGPICLLILVIIAMVIYTRSRMTFGHSPEALREVYHEATTSI